MSENKKHNARFFIKPRFILLILCVAGLAVSAVKLISYYAQGAQKDNAFNGQMVVVAKAQLRVTRLSFHQATAEHFVSSKNDLSHWHFYTTKGPHFCGPY